MTFYGTGIESDVTFSRDFSRETEKRYDVRLSSGIPAAFKESVMCSTTLFRSHGRKIDLGTDRAFEGNGSGQLWSYHVRDVARFCWFGGERTIYCEFDAEGNDESLTFWFVHQMLPFYLTMEGMYDFIHAAAVEVAGRPIFFIAPSMGGKSTLTDCFIKKGHLLVSDDKVPTFVQDGKFMAVPSHAYHRPSRTFEEFGSESERTGTSIKPIHAIYILDRSEGDAPTDIEEIKGFEKFDVLTGSHLYSFPRFKPGRLKYLGKMLNEIRVFRVKRPWDMSRLDETCQAICLHSRELS